MLYAGVKEVMRTGCDGSLWSIDVPVERLVTDVSMPTTRPPGRHELICRQRQVHKSHAKAVTRTSANTVHELSKSYPNHHSFFHS